MILLIKRALSRSLQFDWGCIATMLVVFDLAVTPLFLNGQYSREQEGFLHRDSTPAESSLGNIQKFANLMGRCLGTCGNLYSYLNPTSDLFLNRKLTVLQPPHHRKRLKCLGNNFRLLGGRELQGGSRSFLTDSAVLGGHKYIF